MARKFSPIILLALIFAFFYDRNPFDPDSIRGMRVLITGASSGIGEQLAYQYSKLGAAVVVVARREKLLQKVASTCKELGAKRVDYVAADMARPSDRQMVVRETEKRLGGLDHLILNHGVMSFRMWHETAENMTFLHDQLQVNYVSFVDLASRAFPMLLAAKGRIGVVSSMAGKISTAYAQSYSATKFALQGFFTGYREELKLRQTGMSVTLCVLGMIDTDAAQSITHQQFPFMPDANTSWIAVHPARADDTALAIMHGVSKRAYEIAYPKSNLLIMFVHKLFPSYVENFLSFVMHKAAGKA